MIAALVFAFAAAQTSPANPPAPRPEIARALRLDPRTLPRAPAERWKDFDPKKLAADDVPPSLRSIGSALAAHDLAAAVDALQRSLVEQPDFPPAWHQLGVTYFRLQRYGDAAVALERYLSVAPARIGDTRALGHAYYSLGRYAEAQSHYERVISGAPDDLEARRGLALTLMKLGDSKRALEMLRDVVRRDPTHREAWTWIAQILYDAEEVDEALAAATTARDLDPFEARPWFLIGKLLGELGREADSIAAVQRFEMLSNARQEVQSLETRLELDPHQIALHARLAEIHRGTGDIVRARAALTRGLEIAPGNRDLRLLALDVLESLGDAAGARAAAQALESKFEDDAGVWQRLEIYYAKLRDRPNQMRAGERYRRLR